MPELFRKNGYNSMGTGKMYHQNLPPHFDPPSWTNNSIQYPAMYNHKYVFPPSINCNKNAPQNKGKLVVPSWMNLTNTEFCAINADKNGKGAYFVDVNTTDDGLLKLRYLADQSKSTGEPFFLGVGFRKPHLPWRVPVSYVERYGYPHSIPLPQYGTLDRSVPPVAFHMPFVINKKGYGFVDPWTPVPNKTVQTLRLYYYAAVDWFDTMIGRMIDDIDALGLTENTVIVFHADHGWSLGDRNEWEKMSLWEEAARVPMIVSVPWLKQSWGSRTSSLVELVDLYPTLAELTNLSLPKGESAPIQGQSFASLLTNPTLPAKKFTITQHPRCVKPGTKAWGNNICMQTERSKFSYMGYSIRTDQWRYTEWPEWNGKTLRPIWSQVGNRTELYDHRNDNNKMPSVEQFNIASKYPTIAKQLSTMLHSAIGSGL
jgi:iduronate 2-sulfatase